MKRILLKMMLCIVFILAFSIRVYAASANLSVSSKTVYAGDKFTVTANVNSAASWDVQVNATGPVTGCKLHEADASANAGNVNKKFSASCKTTGTGSITITLSGDITAANGSNYGVSDTVVVHVTEKPVDTRSTNNKLSSIGVEGYGLVTVDEEHYSLTVKNSVSNITINATAEDNKASIDGIGSKELTVGENIFEIVVTAENGSKRTYEIAVTRKDDKYFLEDIDDALLNDSPVNIILNSGDLISKEVVDKIIESKKTVYFNLYSDNKIVYSWIIDGNKVTESEDIYTELVFEPKEKDEFGKKTNYADGIYVKVLNNKFGDGISTRIYVGDKYEDGDFLKAYTGEDLALTEESLKVENGYVEIVPNNEVYFFTKSSLEKDGKSKPKNNKIFVIISIVEAIIIVGLVASKFIKPKKKEDKPIEKTIEENNTLPEETKEEETTIVFPSSQL